MDNDTSTLTPPSTTGGGPHAGTPPTSEAEDRPSGIGDVAPATRPPASQPPSTVLTLGEAGGLIAVMTVTGVAVTSLALAQLGHHQGWLAVALGGALAAVLLGAAWLIGGRLSVSVDKLEVALVLAVVAAAALFFLPGFPYAFADKDPGIYVTHGLAIAHHGSVNLPDVPHERGLAGRYFPGVWVAPGSSGGEVTSQFYHLPSALFATADDLAGPRALFNVTPALAVLSVLLYVLAARRAANTWVAAIAGALLVTSMIQVWQAKYPSSEIPAQLCLSGALLAAVLAIDRRWAGGAFIAGLLLGVGFLTRPDGFLYMVLGVGVVAFAIALGRFDRRSVALALGMAVTAPYAGWNAYVARADYSSANSVPGPLRLALACAALVGLGCLVRAVSVAWSRRRAERVAPRAALAPVPAGDPGGDVGTAAGGEGEDRVPARGFDVAALVRRFQVPIGTAVTLATAAVLVLFWFREQLFGPDYKVSPVTGGRVPAYDERNLRWLALFTTRPGLVLLWLGVALLLLARSPRSKPALFVLALPGAVLLPLYLYNARISMRMMWWVRRFVPAVLPAIALLTALALAWAILHRSRPLKVAGVVATVALVATLAGQSWPLHHHREMGGSWDIAYEMSRVPGDRQGVFLFTDYTNIVDPMRNTPVTLWWVFDEVAAKLPSDYDLEAVERYQEAFPGQPIYLVLHDTLPPNLPASRFREVKELAQPITFWEESTTSRPDGPVTVTRGLTIWQLRPAGN